MTVVQIDDISRRDSLIHYRRQYTATAVVRHVASDGQSVPIAFTIEQSATETPAVSVDIRGPLDYPVIPATHVLREYILKLDLQGKLP
ncbi:MAG: hypothetical protein EA384_04835 [Spirochaetaceae bacterium]|nr:MAG: hypothetical protein EA384_04835 [Spirochaetaceae bacterium]